jgi:23S rRNA (pseudouridine1915-N3)-methyltransferase
MNITLIAVDKLRDPHIRAACAEYQKRLAPYFRVDVVELRASRDGVATAAEAQNMLARADGIPLWALDRAGTALTSNALAKKLSVAERSGARGLAFAIGGADGLHASVLSRADFRWSLSALTFLHEMSRLVVLEQLYRAAKINRGEPYHR